MYSAFCRFVYKAIHMSSLIDNLRQSNMLLPRFYIRFVTENLDGGFHCDGRLNADPTVAA